MMRDTLLIRVLCTVFALALPFLAAAQEPDSFIGVGASAGRSIVTSDGTWTFGAQVQQPGNLLLNGKPVGDNMAMIAAHGGVLYALRHDTTWWAWRSGAWSCAHETMGGDPCP